ncbi:MAG: ComF family protein [Oscillospiraceae bacterium]
MRSFRPEGAAGRKIPLIDDVCTTGATLSCIAEKLRKAGAESVSAAVFARTPKPK